MVWFPGADWARMRIATTVEGEKPGKTMQGDRKDLPSFSSLSLHTLGPFSSQYGAVMENAWWSFRYPQYLLCHALHQPTLDPPLPILLLLALVLSSRS